MAHVIISDQQRRRQQLWPRWRLHSRHYAALQDSAFDSCLLHRPTLWNPHPPQEVTAVRKRKNLGIPNSIEIHWGERRREFFTSFLSREDAFRLIVAAWHQSAPDKAAAQMFSTGKRKREQSSQFLFVAREAGGLLLLLSYGRGSSAGAAEQRTGIPCGNLADIVRQKLWQPCVQLCFKELLFKLVCPLLCSGEDRAVSDVGGICLSACSSARQRRRRERRAGGGPGELPNQVGKPADAADGVGAAPRERARRGTGRLRHRRGTSIFNFIELQASSQHYEFSARLV